MRFTSSLSGSYCSSCSSSCSPSASRSIVAPRSASSRQARARNACGTSSRWLRRSTRLWEALWRDSPSCWALRWRSRAISKSTTRQIHFHWPIRFLPRRTSRTLIRKRPRKMIKSGAREHQVFKVYQTLTIHTVIISQGKKHLLSSEKGRFQLVFCQPKAGLWAFWKFVINFQKSFWIYS